MDRVLPPSKLVMFVTQFKAQYYSKVMSLLLINAHTDVAGASSVEASRTPLLPSATHSKHSRGSRRE